MSEVLQLRESVKVSTIQFRGTDSWPEMVLFFCSFLALRSEDTKTEITAIADSLLHNEKELFGGYVMHADRLALPPWTDSSQENRR
jgi:hypothetical protein